MNHVYIIKPIKIKKKETHYSLNENYTHHSGKEGVTGDYRKCKQQFIANAHDCVDVINMFPCYFLICSDIIYPAPDSLSPWWQSNRTFCGEKHKQIKLPPDSSPPAMKMAFCSPLKPVHSLVCLWQWIPSLRCLSCNDTAAGERPSATDVLQQPQLIVHCQYTPSLTVEEIWKPLTLIATQFSTITDVSQSATVIPMSYSQH